MELRRNATNEPICKAVKETRTSLVAQTVKCLSTMQETWVRSLGREESVEKEMAAHSSTLSWKIPWMEEPGGLQSMESQRVGPTERLYHNRNSDVEKRLTDTVGRERVG